MNELDATHVDRAALESGLDEVRRSPGDNGRIELIVRRPSEGEREILTDAELDAAVGLRGDNWKERGSRATDDGSAHPDLQITLMNARAASLIAGQDDRRPLAGDQLFVDLDLSRTNIPPGTRLKLGSAMVEITDEPHLGCGKFAARFGVDALKFVNSEVGRELNLRGVNAKVVAGGVVRSGDSIRKAESA